MFGLYCRFQQPSIHDPFLRCKLFDALVMPILCNCCEIWYVLQSKAADDDMERVEIGFLCKTRPFMSCQNLRGTQCT